MSGYDLYNCRNEAICNEYKPDKFIFNTDGDDAHRYLRLDPSDQNFLSNAQEKYRENMNNLYKCALVDIQINAINITLEAEKDPDVASRIDTRLENKIQVLKKRAQFCNNTGSGQQAVKKLEVLKQSSYEICKYTNYLYYLQEYSSNLSNTLDPDVTELQVLDIVETQSAINNNIQQELDHSLKVFPLAYTAYIQYENYIAIHFMLELIREDFIVLRTRLQQVLSPISQLVYKASNSMRIQ